MLRFRYALMASLVFTVATPAARAASETVIYSFKGGSDGVGPDGGMIDVGGTLYGATIGGGNAACSIGGSPSGCGTIFKISPANVESVLYAFKGGTDGALPVSNLLKVGNDFYGVTLDGGNPACSDGAVAGCGLVFKVAPSGKESIVYSFLGGDDGAHPVAGLTEVAGILYGTTTGGGTSGNGTVFALTLSGSHTVLHSFAGGSDSQEPGSTLVPIGNTLYGTTDGTAFSITTAGAETVLHNFTDGYYLNGLTLEDGTFYGTALQGGTHSVGIVFSLTPGGTETLLQSFAIKTSGCDPRAPFISAGGSLYGTTSYCGGGSKNNGGTVFEMRPVAGSKLKVLHAFTALGDGNGPNSLTKVGGSLFASTSGGGANGQGAVVKITK